MMCFSDQNLDACVDSAGKHPWQLMFSCHNTAHVLSRSYKGFFSPVPPRLGFSTRRPGDNPRLPTTATALLKMYN